MSALSLRAGRTLRLAIALGAGLVFVQARAATAQQQQNVDFNVSGTSTIRGWTCSVKGVMAISPGIGSTQPAPGLANGVESATVTVAVKDFKCPNDEMTQHLLEAMKADKFPEIVYRLERYEVKGGQAQTTGTLTVTGVSQPINLPVALKASDQGIELEGNTRLDMTKFGVDPPVVMLGLLKVGPQIRIELKGVIAR